MKSKTDPNWDVMKYKYHYELEHQWELKRKFIEAHKTKYPEERLVCLAQLFCNVHFMGCSYEDNIMKLMRELSEGIADKNTKWEKQSFVSASDAVEDRVKSRLNAPQRGPPHQQQHTPAYSSFHGFKQSDATAQSNQPQADVSQSKFIKFIQKSVHGDEGKQESKLWGDSSQTNYAAPEPVELGSSPNPGVKRPGSPIEEDTFYANKRLRSNFTEKQIKEEVRFVVDSGPFGRVVLFQSAVTKESNIAIMERTASAAQMRLNYNFLPPKKRVNKHTDSTTCKLSLDGMFLSSATGLGQKAAKDMACKMAIEHLKETSFTILVKAVFSNESGSEVDRSLSSADSRASSVDKPISDNNIGNKMLKLMGWSGGGLGKAMQGIEEPIIGSGTIKREGLGGSMKEGEFNRKIHALLQEYAMGESKDDLVFSIDFSKEERKAIHEASRKYNLKSKSYGNESNRQLVIFKKTRPLEIVEDLLMCGCETPKYKLLPPKSMINRFIM